MARTKTAMTISTETAFEVVTCCHAGCGVQFAVPVEWARERRRDHVFWYCPSGHQQHWGAETEEERLKKELASVKDLASYLKERLEREQKYALKLDRSRSALRGVATRLRNKAKQGECAFCTENFPDLAAHMAEAHADVDPETVEGEEPA